MLHEPRGRVKLRIRPGIAPGEGIAAVKIRWLTAPARLHAGAVGHGRPAHIGRRFDRRHEIEQAQFQIHRKTCERMVEVHRNLAVAGNRGNPERGGRFRWQSRRALEKEARVEAADAGLHPAARLRAPKEAAGHCHHPGFLPVREEFAGVERPGQRPRPVAIEQAAQGRRQCVGGRAGQYPAVEVGGLDTVPAQTDPEPGGGTAAGGPGHVPGQVVERVEWLHNTSSLRLMRQRAGRTAACSCVP